MTRGRRPNAMSGNSTLTPIPPITPLTPNPMDEQLDDTSAFAANRPLGEQERCIIKAVGVGGGGNNAVNHMYNDGIRNVSFVNINSDRQALRHSSVPNVLEIGNGLGAGNKPEIARAFAEDATEHINALFDDDTKMVFVTAGMGGGTGTGAGPVVARVAKERGLLTIGIVTIPFLFEGQVKIAKAIAGADEMAKHVDALLVIHNERLNEIYGDLDFMNAFGKADETLSIAARSISELINNQGVINLDFNDVDTTLRQGGAAIISTGYGEGQGRVTAAIQDALNSPLLKNRDIMGSKKLLFNIYFNPNAEDKFLMSESNELTSFISSLNGQVDVIWGLSFDETLGNKVKITILAAGFDSSLREEEKEIEKKSIGSASAAPDAGFVFTPPASHTAPTSAAPQMAPQATAPQRPQSPQGQGMQPQSQPQPPVQPPLDPQIQERIIREYGAAKASAITEGHERSSAIILTLNQLDDDMICDTLERTPAYKRDRRIIDSIRTSAYDTGAATNPYSSASTSTAPQPANPYGPATPGSGKSFSF